ncbi:MAG: hypothetical protein JKY09_00895 [Crocinitomicaceae bacterium]|nr:hypothetical protein [Crocinitomicaceae bacterium]
MRNLHLYIGICFSATIISMLFPYMVYDVYESKVFFEYFRRPPKLIQSNIEVFGIKTYLSYVAPFGMATTYALAVSRRPLRSAISGLIGASLLFVLIVLLTFVLTAEPSFYYGFRNLRLTTGFYIVIIATVGHFVLHMVNLIIVRKSRWTRTDKPIVNDDLPDLNDV